MKNGWEALKLARKQAILETENQNQPFIWAVAHFKSRLSFYCL